ncbi:MAG: single-stranded DNA-binding protein [Gammaproteobacteria bacterium]|nr:single-stranded DNA-binding protein [Gammaproteobacteria bacterium]
MLIQLCNLGRDAELRYTPGGKAVCNLALAYSIGWGGNKKTQWIDGALWGDRAEKLVSHLTKGTKVLIYADDVELEEYQKNGGGTGSKLKCRINNIEFAGAPQPAPEQADEQQAPAQQAPQPAQGQGFDGFEDDPKPF